MHTIQIHERTNKDGTLSLSIPLGQPDTEFDVVLVVQPNSKVSGPRLPPGYYDVLGSVDDETLVAHKQPPMPLPVDLE
jgi:hypothetical protein